MIFLLLKVHNKTGLKYLCKKTTDDENLCYKYKGSGTFWKKHLQKHGDDIYTIILYKTECKDDFKKVALEYSKKLNVVESKNFANLCLEEGQGGNTLVTEDSIKKWKNKRNLYWSNKANREKYGMIMSEKLKGKKKLEEHKRNMRGKRPHVNQKGSNNNNARKVITPFGQFGSIADAAKSLNMSYDNIYYKLTTNKLGWSRA